jgi:hypothetical protein
MIHDIAWYLGVSLDVTCVATEPPETRIKTLAPKIYSVFLGITGRYGKKGTVTAKVKIPKDVGNEKRASIHGPDRSLYRVLLASHGHSRSYDRYGAHRSNGFMR